MIFREVTGNQNEKKKSNNEQVSLSRPLSFGYQQDSDVWLLVWLYKNQSTDTMQN